MHLTLLELKQMHLIKLKLIFKYKVKDGVESKFILDILVMILFKTTNNDELGKKYALNCFILIINV